ncbi:DUF1501 domain-containing protein [Zavarzinella formosa]|uniref:DUF1501 domain-containing protein n=1 Tax=Zavarzinella formosa TaxID=360055 RepID=UPI000303B96E|nr:DUF1501 domain-containing protein [Zavarzinella formosa]
MTISNRRDFLSHVGSGFGAMAFASLLHSESQGAEKARTHHPAKAASVIQIFCPGGMSQVDTFDYRPELEKADGKTFDTELGKQTFAGYAGNYGKSFWKFKQHGQSGRWISDLFPKLSKHVDEMAFIYSMQNKSALHGPAMFMMNSGFIRPGFPSMGAWVNYGLGSMNENLPSFVVLPDVRGLPPGGIINWGAGFLPAVHQGTVLETASGKDPIANLFPTIKASAEAEKDGREFLQSLNRRHAESRTGDTLLEARIANYELAAKLQLSAPETVDLSRESKLVHELYQLTDEDIGPFGRQCLLARRLVERKVRFVQIFCGAENTNSKKIRPNWDSHEDIVRDHGYWGRILDTGASALLSDLKRTGLLDSTLVICTTEFGRQPFMQGKQKGRDHNPGVFTSWLAGGGIKGGVGYGSSDEFGFKAAEKPSYSYDLHATALHLLGLDHEKLTFYQNGIPRRLTDVHGHVIREILREA